MSSIFDKYLDSLSEKKIIGEKKIKALFNSVKNNSKELSIKGKIKFEVEKTKLELKKKYIKLGKHVSKQFFSEEMTDVVTGLSEEDARARAAKRIEMRETLDWRVNENLRRHSDDPQGSPSLLNDMYRGPRGNRTTGAQTQITRETMEPRLPQVWNSARNAWEIPPEVQAEYAKILSMYENGEMEEGERAGAALIQALENDNPGIRYKLHDHIINMVKRLNLIIRHIIKYILLVNKISWNISKFSK